MATASRLLRAGALAMVGVACARPQAGTEMATSEERATPAVVESAPPEAPVLEEPVVEEPLPSPELTDGDQRAISADVAEPPVEAPGEAAVPAPETEPTPAVTTRRVAAPPAEEPDYRRDEERLKALGAVYRERLRALERGVRSAEQAVELAEAELRKAREWRTLPVGIRLPTDLPCVPEEPVVVAIPSPDPAAAEERLAQARDALKRARDAEDDLLTTIRRERIPLGYVL